jgi:hypothetical protein
MPRPLDDVKEGDRVFVISGEYSVLTGKVDRLTRTQIVVRVENLRYGRGYQFRKFYRKDSREVGEYYTRVERPTDEEWGRHAARVAEKALIERLHKFPWGKLNNETLESVNKLTDRSNYKK